MSKDSKKYNPTPQTTVESSRGSNEGSDDTGDGDSNTKLGNSNDNTNLLLSGIITQTDRFGNPLNHHPPPPLSRDESKDVQDIALLEEDPVDDAKEPPKPYVQRFLCCLFVYNRKSQRDNRNRSSPKESIALRASTTTRPASSTLHTSAGTITSSTSDSTFHQNEDQINHHAINISRRPIHYPKPTKMPAIEPQQPRDKGKKCLALDLDETLVHSSFEHKDKSKAHIIIPVNIDGRIMDVYVIKRPGVDQFLQRLSEYYELLIYTASLSKYADPLLDKLDVNKVLSRRLYRENCAYFEGHYVKDLYLLNRDLSQTIIVDNSPMSYKFHTKNAIDCGTFIDDPSDTEMWQIADFLISIAGANDVTQHCNSWKEWCKNQSINYASFINPVANKPNPLFVAAPSTVTNVKPTSVGGGGSVI